MTTMNAKTAAFPYPSAPIDPRDVVAITQLLIGQGIVYGLGDKLDPSVAPAKIRHGAKCDCSGFVRYLMIRLGEKPFPDGSVAQHEWCNSVGLKRSTFDDARNQDGAVRIAFLSPKDGGGVGHVMLVVDGMTCESHGGKGVDRRAWGSAGFMSKCEVYVLVPPTAMRGAK